MIFPITYSAAESIYILGFLEHLGLVCALLISCWGFYSEILKGILCQPSEQMMPLKICAGQAAQNSVKDSAESCPLWGQ